MPESLMLPPAVSRSLRRKRRVTRAVLLFERLWPAVCPALGVAGLYLCFVLLDVPLLLPAFVDVIILAAFVLAFGALLVVNLRKVSLPDTSDVDRRLERESGLRHRPLEVLTDKPAALSGASGDILWQLHLKRATAQIGRLRLGPPRPGMAARDTKGLRLGLVVALFSCGVIAGNDAPARLWRGFLPAVFDETPVPETVIQAWATPPGYTGLAPLFLSADRPSVSIPAGSHLSVNVTGGRGTPTLSMGGQPQVLKPLDGDGADSRSFQGEFDLTLGGRLAVRRRGADIAGWDVAAVADTPPTAAFSEPPGRTAHGLQTRLPWTVTDDYGVVKLQAELRLGERPDASHLVLPVPLSSASPKQARGVLMRDLTASPWAGLPVTARLAAQDAPGQVGVSPDAAFVLPERKFKHPIAQALIAIRKLLVLHPQSREEAIHTLNDITHAPDVTDRDNAALLNLFLAMDILRYDGTDTALDAVQSTLWQLALHFEEGTTAQTVKDLAQARRDLHEAMERQKKGEHVDPQEMNRLMQALRKAMQEHLRALTEQAQRDHADPPYDRDGKNIDGKDLDRMADALKDAEEKGDEQAAESEMAELDKALDALQNAHPKKGGAQKAQRKQQAAKEMAELRDIVKREGVLLDHAQQRATPPAPLHGQPPVPMTSEEKDKDSQERQGDQKVQKALRRSLGELMEDVGDLTGKIPENMGNADADMRDSVKALTDDDDSKAMGTQQKTIEDLTLAEREMQQQMSQMMAGQKGQKGTKGQSGDEEGDGEGQGDGEGENVVIGPDGQQQTGSGSEGQPGQIGPGRDPLGRPLKNGTSGGEPEEELALPNQMEQEHTRAIQDELRRRGAERQRPQEELDYIDRLLKQF